MQVVKFNSIMLFLSSILSQHCTVLADHFPIMVTGRPVPILTVNPDDTFCLDEDALRSVLNKPEVKDKPVCLIPVAGTYLRLI